jgi:hypothetical protein
MTRPGLECPDGVASWSLDGREQAGGERGEEDRGQGGQATLVDQHAQARGGTPQPSVEAEASMANPSRSDLTASRPPTEAPAAMAARLSRVPSPRMDVVVLRLVQRADGEHPPTYEPAWIGTRAKPAQAH